MKIESIIKRDPPTEVVLGDTAYQFKPDSQGRHVCEVTDKAHIARLLSIVEGFQIPDDEQAPQDWAPAAPVQPVVVAAPTFQPIDEHVLLGADGYPEVIDLGNGKTAESADVIADAHELSGLTTADWNALEPEVRHNLIDAVLDGLDAPDEDAPAVAEPINTEAAAKAERDELAAQWKARTGSLPHYKWTAAKIRDELAKPVESTKD